MSKTWVLSLFRNISGIHSTAEVVLPSVFQKGLGEIVRNPSMTDKEMQVIFTDIKTWQRNTLKGWESHDLLNKVPNFVQETS